MNNVDKLSLLVLFAALMGCFVTRAVYSARAPKQQNMGFSTQHLKALLLWIPILCGVLIYLIARFDPEYKKSVPVVILWVLLLGQTLIWPAYQYQSTEWSISSKNFMPLKLVFLGIIIIGLVLGGILTISGPHNFLGYLLIISAARPAWMIANAVKN